MVRHYILQFYFINPLRVTFSDARYKRVRDMSESVEISKKLDINIQVDYVKCRDCGEELDFALESDYCGDLQINVERCNCADSDND